jgi:glycosyltransferase involved in cell wall biosynthesis
LIGMVGRVNPGKGQDVFLQAAQHLLKEFPEAYFVSIGEAFAGEVYSDALRAEIKLSGLEKRFLVTGFRRDIAAILSSLDVFVSPSVHPEGFGLSLLEAMASGKPVVATAHGGSLEMIEDGVNGFLVPPGDAEALAARVSDCLRDPARSGEMGRRARQTAMSRFTVERYLERIEAVYDAVVEPRAQAEARHA